MCITLARTGECRLCLTLWGKESAIMTLLKNNGKQKEIVPERESSFGMSIIVLLLAIAVLLFGVVGLKLDPHMPILLSVTVLLIYSSYLHIPWNDMRDSICKSISESIEAILIICLIGVTVGTWMSSGTVPLVIYYGLQIFSPQWFLLSILLLCCIMSIVTGSSWTTVGTIGVAFMGVGIGLGIPVGLTAGAILCGAYFGDKQSPVSDTCNFAAAVSRGGLYEVVRAMIYTTGPSLVVSAVIFVVLGFRYGSGTADTSQIQAITSGLEASFNLTPVLLIPLILLLSMIIMKVPAIPTMIIASLLGASFTFVVQGQDIASCLKFMHTGYVSDTGVSVIDSLLTRGGLNSMTSTVMLMLFSLALAGCLERTGVMSKVIGKISNLTKNRVGLITTTLVMAMALSFFAADPYLAMLLPANAMGRNFDRQGIDRRVLGRTIQDGATVMAPLVPWGTNGIYCSLTLGVAVAEYAPYYLMGYATPIFAVICAITGFGVLYTKKPGKSDEVKDVAEA